MPTAKNVRKSKYAPYAQARLQALDLQLNSRAAYIAWHTETKCKYLPRYPERAYQKDWVSWNDWLGTANVFKAEMFKDIKLRPWWDAVKWAQEFAAVHNLDTMADWLVYWKEHMDELPKDIPVHPDAHYPESDWKPMGWKGWLGTDVRHKVTAAKQSTALLCLASFHGNAKPGNVYAVVNAERGEAELRNVLVANRQLDPLRVYKMLNDDKEWVLDMLAKVGQREAEGWFIPRIGDLLFELDMNLMKHVMAPINYPRVHIDEEELSETMFSYTQRIG